MKKNFYLFALLSLTVISNINAKDMMKKEPQIDGYKVKFEEIEKNGKGYIEEKMYIKYHNKQWKLIDTMKEKVIIKDKFVNNCKKEDMCDPKYKERIFEEWDLNKDGKVTKKEYKLKREFEFANMDKNGDGKITKKQYNAGMDKFKYKYKIDQKTPTGKIKGEYKYEVK